MAERIFTDEELRIGSMRSVDAMAEALERRDRESALFFCKRLRREVLSMQQNYDGWEASLLESIRRTGGAEDEAAAVRSLEDSKVPGDRRGDEALGIDHWRSEAKAILSTLEARHDEDAIAAARRFHDAALNSHDRGMSRVSALLSWITRNHGADALETALEIAMSADMLGDASFREQAEALMHFTRVHLQSFDLQEDDEKITFLCPVCPSGGRLLQAGHYATPDGDAHVPGPRPLTWGRESLPAYCCHEPAMEKSSAEKTGVPLFVVDPPERLGVDPCPTYLYKNPADIPERFYTRLGLEKPKFPVGSKTRGDE